MLKDFYCNSLSAFLVEEIECALNRFVIDVWLGLLVSAAKGNGFVLD